MATFTIVNTSSSEVHLGDFYTTLAAGATLTLSDRSPNEVPDLKSVTDALAAGTITFSITYTANEYAQSMTAAANSVAAADLQETSLSEYKASPVQVFWAPFPAGATGLADDVVAMYAGTMPYPVHITHCICRISTAVASETIQIRNEAAGAGLLLGAFSGAATGNPVDTVTASSGFSPSATNGLFVRRSHDGIAGEAFIYCRRMKV